MASVSAFVGSIPKTYHQHLGPLLFEGYARDMASRLGLREGARLLELACGTGIVTGAVAGSLPPGASLIATDLNEAMLDIARQTVSFHVGVTYRQADACALPFAAGAFDVLFCQFGVMFFPDKALAMREARRVLAPGGRYVFNVWDSLEHNPIPAVVHDAVVRLFPDNPPVFLKVGPYGYFDRAELERVVRAAGFTAFTAEAVELPSVAPTAQDAARGFVEGTPLRVALQERGVTDPAPVRDSAAAALAGRFGDRPCASTMRAIVCTAS